MTTTSCPLPQGLAAPVATGAAAGSGRRRAARSQLGSSWATLRQPPFGVGGLRGVVVRFDEEGRTFFRPTAEQRVVQGVGDVLAAPWCPDLS
jgi:hypothetical protein